ncbi:MAG TPA: MFS transporter [Bryobacteraceae bacterium]|nr:MFS transporter [Bryobacteraceae bacterium]
MDTTRTRLTPHEPTFGTVLSTDQIVARLEGLRPSGWHVRARLVVGAATLFDGIDTLAIAYALPVLTAAWHLSPQKAGVLISAGYLGQLAGAVLFGWLADRIGRVSTIRYTIAIYALLSLVCAFSWSYSSLLVFRILQGLGLGGEVPVAAAYINELAQSKTRGRFFLVYEQTYSAGRLCAALLGVWVVTHLGWRYLFLVGALPAVLVVFLRRSLPESPRWLASQRRMEEAGQAVRDIEIRSSGNSAQRELPRPAKAIPVQHPVSKLDWRELFRGPYRARTATTWVIWFAAFLLLNGLANWVPTLYTTLYRLPLGTALRYGLVSSAAGFAGCIAVTFLIEWTGRRPWYLGAFSLAGLACVALWLRGAPSARAVLLLSSITLFFANSIAMVVFLHTPEIYPTRMRAFATSLASVWLRVASIVAPIFVGFTVARSSLSTVFLVFGLMAWFAAFVSRFIVETKGRVLEEVAP